MIEAVAADPSQRQMRVFMAARSRFAEDCLDRRFRVGSAKPSSWGRDSTHSRCATRTPLWACGCSKSTIPRRRRGSVSACWEQILPYPRRSHLSPLDFARQSLADGLTAAGFRPAEPAFFCWLGVVPYLRREAVLVILEFIAGLPVSEVVFDFSEPLENYSPDRRANVAAIAQRTAAIGEPWLSFFDPVEMAKDLRQLGFAEVEDLGLGDIAVRYLGAARDEQTVDAGPHVIRARRLD